MSDGLTVIYNDGSADPKEGRGRCFTKFWWCFWALVISLVLFVGLDHATADINCIGDSDPRCTDGLISMIFFCGLPMLLSFLGMIVYGIEGLFMSGEQRAWEKRHDKAMAQRSDTYQWSEDETPIIGGRPRPGYTGSDSITIPDGSGDMIYREYAGGKLISERRMADPYADPRPLDKRGSSKTRF